MPVPLHWAALAAVAVTILFAVLLWLEDRVVRRRAFPLLVACPNSGRLAVCQPPQGGTLRCTEPGAPGCGGPCLDACRDASCG